MFTDNGRFDRLTPELKPPGHCPTPDTKITKNERARSVETAEPFGALGQTKEREFEEGEIATPENVPIPAQRIKPFAKSKSNYVANKSIDYPYVDSAGKNASRKHSNRDYLNESRGRSFRIDEKYTSEKDNKKDSRRENKREKKEKSREDIDKFPKRVEVQQSRRYEDNDDADTAEEGELSCEQETRSEPDTDEYMSNWENDESDNFCLMKSSYSIESISKRDSTDLSVHKEKSAKGSSDLVESLYDTCLCQPEHSILDTIPLQLNLTKTNRFVEQNCDRIEKATTDKLKSAENRRKIEQTEEEASLTPPRVASKEKKLQIFTEPSLTPPRELQPKINLKAKSICDKPKKVVVKNKKSPSKPKLEPKIVSLYDEYEQFLLSVESCEAKESPDITKPDKTIDQKLKSPVSAEKSNIVPVEEEKIERHAGEKLLSNEEKTTPTKQKYDDRLRRESNESVSRSTSSTSTSSSTSDSSYSSSDDDSDAEDSSSESSSSSSSSSDSSDSNSSSSTSTSSSGPKNRTKKIKLTKADRHKKAKNRERVSADVSLTNSELINTAEIETERDTTITLPLVVNPQKEKKLSVAENITARALETLGLVWDEHLLSDDDLLLKVETFKIHCKEKRREKEQAGRKKNKETNDDSLARGDEPFERQPGDEEKVPSACDDILNDPNRSMIKLKLRTPAPNSNAPSAGHVDNHVDFTERLQHREPSKSKSSTAEERSTSDKRSSKHETTRSKRSKDRKSSTSHSSSSRKRHRSRTPQSSKYSSSNDLSHRRRSSRGSSVSPAGKNRRRNSISPSVKSHRRRSSYKSSHTSGGRSGRKSSLTPPKSSQRYHSRHQKSISPLNSRRHRTKSSSPLHHVGKLCSMSPQPAPRGPRTPPNTPPADSMHDNDMGQFGPMGGMPPKAVNNGSWDGGLSPSPMKMQMKSYSNYDYDTTPIPTLHNAGPYRQPPQPIPYGDSNFSSYMHPHRLSVPHLSHVHPTHYHLGPHQMQHGPAYGPPSHGQHHQHPLVQHLPHHHHDPHQVSFGPPPHVLGSGDGFYYQTVFETDPRSTDTIDLSNLIEVNVQPQKGKDYYKEIQQSVVQKGNVLEIVPGFEVKTEKSNSDEEQNQAIDAQRQLIMQQQMRLKQKLERQQKRLAKEKRKEFMVAEIKRLNDQLLVGMNGKMIRASDLFANPAWRHDMLSTEVTPLPAIESNPEPNAENEPTLHVYDPMASAGKSILAERNAVADTPNTAMYV